MTEDRLWMTPKELLLATHRWHGYACSCGAEINSPQSWGSHLVDEAWKKFTLIGIESAKLQRSRRDEQV